jgi:hypothetical protein
MGLLKKYIVCVSLIFLMFGCTARQYVSSSKDMDGFNTKKKGIVILQSVSRTGLNKEWNSLKTTWRNDNGKYFTADPQNTPANGVLTLMTLGSVSGILNNDVMVYFIEPGEYNLSDAYFENKYALNMENIMSFNLVGGEIIYLGKIVANYNYVTVVNALNIEDFYSDAVKYFKKQYPDIDKAPIKRLIQFSNCAQIVKQTSNDFGLME